LVEVVKKNLTESVFEDRVGKAIDAQKYRVREALKEVERNTRISYQSHIDYHKHLLREAKAHGEVANAMHHQIMVETYQSILKNYTMSNSYDNV